MDKQQRIANELRTRFKVSNEFSDDEIMKITKGSLSRASVEYNIAVEELSANLQKEFPWIEKYLSNANNAILKLQNFINKICESSTGQGKATKTAARK